jgi:hypothetical protein
VGRCDPELDLGTKMGPGKPKNKSAQNGFKIDVCVGLINMNPTQLERYQTNLYPQYIAICLFHQTGKKKDVVPYSPYSVDMEVDYTGRMVVQMTWKGMLALTWVGTGGPVRV